MENYIKKMDILRLYSSGKAENIKDELLEENSVELEVDGNREASVILSCGNEKIWALGYLACRKMINSMEDVEDLQLTGRRVVVSRAVSRHGSSPDNRHINTGSAVLKHPRDPSQEKCNFLPVQWKVDAGVIFSSVQRLREADVYKRTGNAHVATLISSSGEVLFTVEDIGRHNTMDKAVGWALMQGLKMVNCFLAVSGRLPSDMVQKAAGAGIPMLVSVSAATASGVETAIRQGITLVGFAREGRMNVYSFPERIESSAQGS